MYYVNHVRRWLIRRLIGRMEVCMNMTISNEGAIEYGGRHGGAICENITFITREPAPE